jgi:hypothetical protein
VRSAVAAVVFRQARGDHLRLRSHYDTLTSFGLASAGRPRTIANMKGGSRRWEWGVLIVIAAAGLVLCMWTWDRNAAQQLGAALTGGAVIAFAVLMVEHRAAERHREVEAERVHRDRAERVWLETHPVWSPRGGEGAQWLGIDSTVRNGSGYPLSDCRSVLLLEPWARTPEPVVWGEPQVLVVVESDRAGFEPHRIEMTDEPPKVAVALLWTDHDRRRWVRWPNRVLDCLGKVA